MRRFEWLITSRFWTTAYENICSLTFKYSVWFSESFNDKEEFLICTAWKYHNWEFFNCSERVQEFHESLHSKD